MTVNCRSLKSKKKKKKFYALIASKQPDIILGTESHLASSHSNSETFPAPYLALRKDMNINRGGVFIAYRNDLNLIEMENTGENSELKTAKLIRKNTTPLYLAMYYRSPSSTIEDLENLQQDLDRIKSEKDITEIILADDFNVPHINWKTNTILENPQYGIEINEKM